jgi:hypothetical protein
MREMIMKRSVILFTVLVLSYYCGNLQAQTHERVEEDCPSHLAIQRQSGLFEQLHQVMASAWHNAYPNQDYEALRGAIKKFNAKIPKLEELDPTFKTSERKEKFNRAREWFIKLVDQGKRAGAAGDDESLYDLMPDLHNKFEEMAFYLLSVHYPEYESFKIVVDLMIDTHLGNDDYEAIITSLEALKIKNEMLQKADVPQDLKSAEEAVILYLKDIDKICNDLDSACRSKNNKTIKDNLLKLAEFCRKFDQKFI